MERRSKKRWMRWKDSGGYTTVYTHRRPLHPWAASIYLRCDLMRHAGVESFSIKPRLHSGFFRAAFVSARRSDTEASVTTWKHLKALHLIILTAAAAAASPLQVFCTTATRAQHWYSTETTAKYFVANWGSVTANLYRGNAGNSESEKVWFQNCK